MNVVRRLRWVAWPAAVFAAAFAAAWHLLPVPPEAVWPIGTATYLTETADGRTLVLGDTAGVEQSGLDLLLFDLRTGRVVPLFAGRGDVAYLGGVAGRFVLAWDEARGELLAARLPDGGLHAAVRVVPTAPGELAEADRQDGLVSAQGQLADRGFLLFVSRGEWHRWDVAERRVTALGVRHTPDAMFELSRDGRWFLPVTNGNDLEPPQPTRLPDGLLDLTTRQPPRWRTAVVARDGVTFADRPGPPVLVLRAAKARREGDRDDWELLRLDPATGAAAPDDPPPTPRGPVAAPGTSVVAESEEGDDESGRITLRGLRVDGGGNKTEQWRRVINGEGFAHWDDIDDGWSLVGVQHRPGLPGPLAWLLARLGRPHQPRARWRWLFVHHGTGAMSPAVEDCQLVDVPADQPWFLVQRGGDKERGEPNVLERYRRPLQQTPHRPAAWAAAVTLIVMGVGWVWGRWRAGRRRRRVRG